MLKKFLRKIAFSIPSSYFLMFHHVTGDPAVKRSGCLINTEKFVNFLSSHHVYRSIDDVIGKPSKKGIVVTFDDGLLDLYTVAYPCLKLMNIPFAAFIVTDFLGQAGYITKNQLLELSNDPLVTIGSHGVTHSTLTKVSFSAKKNEILESKKILEDLTGREVRYFAYSHGQYDTDVLNLAKVYNSAFSTAERPFNIMTCRNLFAIPRFNIDSNTIERQISFFDNVKF